MKSQSILFSWIKREQRTLTQRMQTTIKSIYEGGNKANISENERDIILVNIILKVYEIVKIKQNEKNNTKCHRYKQLEGKKGKNG